MVSNDLKEAAYSLGATRKEVILNVLIPNARSGIFTSFILAFGRAIGETMAVTMLIGNSNLIPSGIFDTGNTMASVIANQFGEADGLKLSALIAIGLLLFVITGLINGLGKPSPKPPRHATKPASPSACPWAALPMRWIGWARFSNPMAPS